MLVIHYFLWASVLLFRLDMSIIMAEGPKYETAYACDGKMLKIECKDGDVINLIRANYGRFSIVVCNDHGSTEWSVNCMSHKSISILQTRCSQKRNCSIQANTSLFGDPCPGTVKYLEAHYHCVSATLSSSTHRPAPPWLMTTSPSVWSTPKSLTVVTDIVPPAATSSSTVYTEKSSSLSSVQSEKQDESNWSSNTFPPSAQVTSESQNVSVQITTELNSVTVDNTLWMLSDDKAPLCKPVYFRNLLWNWTYGGEITVQSCPSGVDGFARWRCQVISKNIAIRFPDTPDLSECKSIWITNLNSRMIDGDTVLKVANDLALVTESKTLYGGDIIIACKLIRDMVQKMMRDLPTFLDPHQREAAVNDLFQWVAQTGNNMLDVNSLPSWLDLAYKEQMQMASSLLVGLEESSFLLATTFSRETTVTRCKRNIILQVKVLESRNVGDVIFPSALGSDCRITTGNYIQLTKSCLMENSELGIIRVLYVAFDTLENILKTQSVGKEEKRINSKILSASLGRGRHIQLKHPVTLCFEHLQTENVSNPSCVFWDYTQNMWSEDGCMLVSTNKTHSTCQCNHLTNFAILADIKPSGPVSNEFSLQSVLLFTFLMIIVALIVLIVVYQYVRSVKTRKEYGSFVQDSVWITKCFVCCQSSSTTSVDPEKTLNCKDTRPTLYGNTTVNNINSEEITIQPTRHQHHNLSTHHAANTLPRSFMNENGVHSHYPLHAPASVKMNHYPTYSRNGSIRKIKEARRLEHIENALQHRNRKLSGTTLRSNSPRSHTYSEIVSATSGSCRAGGDPVYEEIEREKEHCSQVSDISDEDGKKHSDMSRQSSKSYGDHRPLIPYSAVTDRDFHLALDAAFRNQFKEQNARTVSVLDGETVVCHLQSPDTRMYNKTMGHSSHHY